MKRYALLLSMLAVSANAAEPLSQYNFETETCKATVSYDPSVYDVESVKNTANFLFGQFNLGAAVRKGSSGDECLARVSRIRSSKFVDLPSLKALVADAADGTEASCALNALEERGLSTPAVLREFPDSEACYPAVDALEGKTDLVQYWREMINVIATKNGDSRGYLAKQLAHQSTPDFQDWLRRQILTHGWHNCANNTLEHFRAAERQHRAEAEQEFAKKFQLKEFDCDFSAVD